MRHGAILMAALALAGCAADRGTMGDLSPPEAVIRAATAAPRGVSGTFALRVRATGRQDGNIYLNSEEDYRDQRNLTVAIWPIAQDQIARRLGRPADEALRGHRIRVDGEARRVRIDFTDQGRPTGKYYYQTHVDVTRADQIVAVD